MYAFCSHSKIDFKDGDNMPCKFGIVLLIKLKSGEGLAREKGDTR